MTGELQLFVREALARGIARGAIHEQLAHAGWREEEIDAALAAYAESDFPVPVPRRRPYLSAREAFLYLVLFATLYTAAVNCGSVLFLVIDRALPDPLRAWETGRAAGEGMRNATAAIIIAFPVFLLLSRHIGGLVARDPAKRGSPIRKWLTYATLFVAALVIIGDLTVLVARALGGELPPRFLLKVATVFAIAGTAFGHYLGDLRREESEGAATARRRAWGARAAAVAVAAVAVLGIVSVGAPSRARGQALDDRRIEDLRQLAAAVDAYYADVGALPGSLAEAMRPPRMLAAGHSADPETKAPYGYDVVDSTSYRLCAVFALPGAPESADAGGEAEGFWRHAAGRFCFRFTAGRVAARALPEPPRRAP